MNEQEFNALMLKIEASIGTSMDTKLKDAFKTVDPLVLETISKESEGLKKTIGELETSNTKLDDAQKTQADVIADLTEKLNSGKIEGATFKEQVKSLLTANQDKLTAMKAGDSKTNIRMTMKAAGDMTFGNSITGQIPQGDREAGITRAPRRQPFIVDLINVGSITSNLWEWVQLVNPDGDAAMTAEGALKAKIDFDLVLAQATVRKVTAFVKVSKEMLDDVPLMEAEINQELTEKINLKIDVQLLSGDGTGQNIVGILENATAFAAGSFAASVDEANNQDVLRVGINQVMVALFQPNYIVMHPSDVTAMDLQKASDGHYVLPPFSTGSNTIIKGIPIVSNTGVTEGDFLVGDFTKSGVRFREGLVFDIGYENDDFTKNFVTILAEARMVHRVKSNDYPAFVKGTFTTAKAALETA
jgi:HK97 family phage major capsid protein